MVGTNPLIVVERMTHGFFKLTFAGVAVAGQDLLGLSYRYFLDRDANMAAGQKNDAGYFAEGYTRLRVFFQREYIFDNHLVGHFATQDIMQFGVNPFQALRLRFTLGRGDTAKGVALDMQPLAPHDANACVSQTGINADDFHSP